MPQYLVEWKDPEGHYGRMEIVEAESPEDAAYIVVPAAVVEVRVAPLPTGLEFTTLQMVWVPQKQ